MSMNNEDAVKLYAKKLANGNFHLYKSMPLGKDDYEFADALENNFQKVRQVIFTNSLRMLGYDIKSFLGLRNSFSVKDIKKSTMNLKSTQKFPLPIDDQLRKKLLKTDKFLVKISPVSKITSSTGKKLIAQSLYFVSKIKYKDNWECVLIRVDIVMPVQKMLSNDSESASSISITAQLGRNADVDLNLGRLDFKPCSAHQNFLDENEKVLPTVASVWRNNLVFGTHFHFNSEKSQALKPSNLSSGNATAYKTTKTFLPLVEEFLSKFNFYGCCEDYSEKSKLSTIHDEQKSIKKPFSSKLLWGGEENNHAKNSGKVK